MTQNDEPPVERKKSRWWPINRGATRILPALRRAVSDLLFIAVGALLFISVYYVATLNRNILLVLGAATVVAAVTVLIRVGQRYEWTGFGQSVQPKQDNQEIQPRKTLWDWLQLLIVPVALAGIGFWFTVQQDVRQQQIENQRAEAERMLAKQRAQDEALQAYLNQMSTLMLEKDLRNSEEDSEVRTLARARTLTVIRRVDTSRKDEIMQFLLEAALVRRVGESAPVIELGGADLDDTSLSGADLDGADLGGANLREADLSDAVLDGANLREADLSGPDLSGADLREADLREADLSYAKLDLADVSRANLNNVQGITNEKLAQQALFLKGATMPNGQKYEDWLKDREKRQQDE